MTNSAVDKGTWGKEHSLIAKIKNKNGGELVYRTAEAKYKGILDGMKCWESRINAKSKELENNKFLQWSYASIEWELIIMNNYSQTQQDLEKEGPTGI